jgi:hypothetical protein
MMSRILFEGDVFVEAVPFKIPTGLLNGPRHASASSHRGIGQFDQNLIRAGQWRGDVD